MADKLDKEKNSLIRRILKKDPNNEDTIENVKYIYSQIKSTNISLNQVKAKIKRFDKQLETENNDVSYDEYESLLYLKKVYESDMRDYRKQIKTIKGGLKS